MEKSDKSAWASRREFLKAGGITAVAATAVALAPTNAGQILASVTSGKKHRWGFLIDLNRCVGCKACAVACKTEFEVPLGVFRSSVKELDEGKFPAAKRSFLPWLCNHCENPACLEGCPVDEVDVEFIWPDGTKEKYSKRATYQRPDGLVLVDQGRCVGCGACVDLCPYKARFLNPAQQTVSEDAVDDYVADKCTLCTHRLEAGLVPACVNTCQAQARLVGDLNDPSSEISSRLKTTSTEVLAPDEGTKPQCHYISLNPNVHSRGRDTR